MKHFYKKNQHGFTLIELLISIGIFSVFIIIVGGVFGKFMEVQRHSIAQGTLILEVQSVMEAFTKEARTAFGSTYWTNNGKQVAFRNQTGACVAYRLNGARGTFERAEDSQNKSGDCRLNTFSSNSFVPLSSNAIKISDVFFDVNVSDSDGSSFQLKNQGFITLVLTASTTKGTVLPITVQNTVTSRQVKRYLP